MPKFDVITIGGAVKDFTFYTNQGKIFSTPDNLTAQKMLAFEYGAKISPTESYLSWGGGAANTAAALARLGFKTAIAVRIGKDEIGRELRANLKKEKINLDFIQIDPAAPTGFSFILATDKKEREHVVFSNRGANNFFLFRPEKLAASGAAWLYLTSLSGKDWQKNLKAVFNLAAKLNIKIIWNPGSLQLGAGKRVLAPYLKQTQILVLNKDEAIELVLSGVKLGRKNPKYLNRPLYLLNILQEWGAKIVVITEGKKGAWAYDGKKIYRQNIKKAKIVNTTGVGDCFGASFLAGLLAKKGDIASALRWGMVNCSSVVGQVGAQKGLLTRKELEAKL